MDKSKTPSARFIDNGDKTVTDTKTGLIWQKTDDGKQRTWKEAKKYCEEISLPGKGWRLPTVEELFNLIDFSRYAPAIDPIFEDTKSDFYWSSTPHANLESGAWLVHFSSGHVGNWSKFNGFYVRVVRQNS